MVCDADLRLTDGMGASMAESNLCVPASDGAVDPGAAASFGDQCRDVRDCPVPLQCLLIDAGGVLTGICSPDCANDADCRVEAGIGRCMLPFWATPSQCALHCASGACPIGLVCVPSARLTNGMGSSSAAADVCVPD
jgi:hypothetical protein